MPPNKHIAPSAPHSPHHAAPHAPATPLWAVLLFTFLNSFGSGVVYTGLFFIAKHQYGFDDTQRFWLGLLYGCAYIPATFYVGHVLRFARVLRLSARGLLMTLMGLMAAACTLPFLAHHLQLSGSWPLWLTVGVYSPLSGILWANVESFLAGGRSEANLRSATGKFNVCWASSIVVTLLLMGPLVERHALIILLALGAVHILCGAIALLTFHREPGAHTHDAHHVVPAASIRLLKLCRVLLPVSFMLLAVISPILPTTLKSLSVHESYQTWVAAVWPMSRVVIFFLMERWHGWHGRLWPITLGAALLFLAFAGVVAGPSFFPAVGLAVLITSLAAFGIGMGVIYCAALYYAMEVSSAGVEAGGKHEAAIGLGYAVGPTCGIAAGALVSAGVVPLFAETPARTADVLMLIIAAAVAIAAVLSGLRWIRSVRPVTN